MIAQDTAPVIIPFKLEQLAMDIRELKRECDVLSRVFVVPTGEGFNENCFHEQITEMDYTRRKQLAQYKLDTLLNSVK